MPAASRARRTSLPKRCVGDAPGVKVRTRGMATPLLSCCGAERVVVAAQRCISNLIRRTHRCFNSAVTDNRHPRCRRGAPPSRPTTEADREHQRGIRLSKLDDSALISLREEMRGELERLPPHSVGHAELVARYDLTTMEINERARVAWSRAT